MASDRTNNDIPGSQRIQELKWKIKAQTCVNKWQELTKRKKVVKHSNSHWSWLHAWNNSTDGNKLCIKVLTARLLAFLLKQRLGREVLAYLRKWRWRPLYVGSCGRRSLCGSTPTGSLHPPGTAHRRGGCSQCQDQTGLRTEPSELPRIPGSCTPPRRPLGPRNRRRLFPSCRRDRVRRGPSTCHCHPPVAGTGQGYLLRRKSPRHDEHEYPESTFSWDTLQSKGNGWGLLGFFVFFFPPLNNAWFSFFSHPC